MKGVVENFTASCADGRREFPLHLFSDVGSSCEVFARQALLQHKIVAERINGIFVRLLAIDRDPRLA